MDFSQTKISYKNTKNFRNLYEDLEITTFMLTINELLIFAGILGIIFLTQQYLSKKSTHKTNAVEQEYLKILNSEEYKVK